MASYDLLRKHARMAPSAIALQKMLNLCYEFSLSNDIIFNSTKSQCIVFKPNRFKLYCPAVYLNGNIIDYVIVTQLYKPLKMHGLLEYSYGILGLKCCILIDHTFDGNMFL